MIDVEAEARAIVDGKGEAWAAAEQKLTQAWEDGDQAAITAWQAVFGRYPELAYELDLDDGFYDYNVWMNAGHYAAGLDPRPQSEPSEEDKAAMAAEDAAFRAECEAGLHDLSPGRDPDLDEDTPY